MQMIWYENILNDAYRFSLLLMNTGFQVQLDSTMTHLQTFGGNIYRMKDPLTLTGTFYYQSGKNQVKQQVNAFIFSIYGNYKINNFWGIHLGTDFLSGKDMDDTDLGRTTEFIPLYGTFFQRHGQGCC
jgi:hypothetical protein